MDTSAIIGGLTAVPGEKDLREAILAATDDVELFAPSSVRWELGNAIRKMVMQKRITASQGAALLQQAISIPIHYMEISPVNAYELAIKLKATAYDAYVLECARETGFPLLTLERSDRMPAKARALKIKVVEVNHHE